MFTELHTTMFSHYGEDLPRSYSSIDQLCHKLGEDPYCYNPESIADQIDKDLEIEIAREDSKRVAELQAMLREVN